MRSFFKDYVDDLKKIVLSIKRNNIMRFIDKKTKRKVNFKILANRC